MIGDNRDTLSLIVHCFHLKKINYGIQGGFGFDFKISDKSKIMTTAGGNYGLVKIQKDKSNGENNTGAATVTLGYIIQL